MALAEGSVAGVVLAGGLCPPDLVEAAGVEERARLSFRGRPMFEWVVDALAATPCVGKLVVVGSVPEAPRYIAVPGGETLLASVRNGTEALPGDRYLLVSADVPFLTPEAITHFCEAAAASGALFCYPIIPMAECDRQFPGVRRTSVRLRDGRFTGGNICYVEASFLRENWARVEAAHRVRKKPFALAAMVGYGALVRAALGQVLPFTWSVGYVERAASRVLGAPVKAIVSPYAGVGTDVDSLEHWRTLQDDSFPRVTAHI
jgi:molybdopterin-guanine dinucleotide biosynthesis protein A